jgi:ubiquinone/menaquinone biosynthesis C-methylase UbiE
LNKNNFIFLPGLDKQLDVLFKNIDAGKKHILVIGANCEEIAITLQQSYEADVFIIVDDNESLLKSRLVLTNKERISVRLMDFENTDFPKEKFDLIFAQGSISSFNRNKIVKEIKRILMPEGVLCVGEIIKLSASQPKFITDIWEASSLAPMNADELGKYYLNKNFSLVFDQDLSYTLKEFYLRGINQLKNKIQSLSENEKSYYKKVLNKINHESNAYLKLGGDKHIGFKMLILKKEA